MSDDNLTDMLDCDAQLMEMFVSNAADLLDQIESDLLKMEHMDGWDEQLVNKVFRSAHTIKGESGFIGLDTIGKLAHSIENVLDKVRERVFEADHETINLLLDCFDALRGLVDDVDNSNDADVSEDVAKLDELLARKMGGEPQAAAPEEAPACETTTETVASTTYENTGYLPGDVLIVDDDPMIQELLKHHLDKNGVTSQASGSCGQCLQMLRNNSYRVIVLDFDLPDGQGVEIINEIKNLHPLAQVIMLTGEVNMHNVVNCLEAGAIDFLPKSNNYKLIVEPILFALTRSTRWRSLLNVKRQAIPA